LQYALAIRGRIRRWCDLHGIAACRNADEAKNALIIGISAEGVSRCLVSKYVLAFCGVDDASNGTTRLIGRKKLGADDRLQVVIAGISGADNGATRIKIQEQGV